ncbi:MAG: CpsD/CapB family tyrosine-protein kinase [Globicatella sulfidifaciens]|uniref:Tyrosine-protein kinase CpsD n=1 Tax=Globicatella sulfidifaciens TaxID=136093 RepID=A0A7X8H0X6_9LACT|nr:CpsD/CapB family tyrosine-protein kinase [Globicatella sulfidifaciens]
MEKDTIITHNNPKSPVSEAYRVLRTNIQFSSVDKPLKTIVVTSAGPMEGKTTTITNLAVIFAQAGSKVLLIDTDLRKPMLHKVFLLLNERGLTNLLTSNKDTMTFIQHDVVKNLDVLTSGRIPPNPSELLSSNAMKNFIENVKTKYDIVLMDSPPVGSVTDATIISTYADGTILVVKSGRTEVDEVKRAQEILKNVNANIIGVVLNHLDKKAAGNNYYPYYYYNDDEEMPKKQKKKTKLTRR